MSQGTTRPCVAVIASRERFDYWLKYVAQAADLTDYVHVWQIDDVLGREFDDVIALDPGCVPNYQEIYKQVCLDLRYDDR